MLLLCKFDEDLLFGFADDRYVSFFNWSLTTGSYYVDDRVGPMDCLCFYLLLLL